MPRDVSTTLEQAIFGQETEEVPLVLLKISHPDLSTPIRVTSDNVDTTHNNETFQAFPFRVNIPESSADELTTVQLQIDNVDRQIVEAIRQISSNPDVEMKIVLASQPDVVEAGPFNFSLKQVSYDALVVEGELGFENLLSMKYPKDQFIPSDFRSLSA